VLRDRLVDKAHDCCGRGWLVPSLTLGQAVFL
jgi:hypothetical protein